MSQLYNFQISSLYDEEIDLSQLKEKVVLIVNTASKCGLTPQYDGLEKLHQQYKEQGLVVLGAPCNQFGRQEPGGASEIASFCLINYGVSFQITEKIKVNGSSAHPLFKWLKKESGGLLPIIKWNFTKFLLDKDGNLIKRFSPKTLPKDIESYIVKALK
jgi:glutathione peroxidase